MSDLPVALLKERPEDFVVEEIPAYAPSGAGGHVYVRFTKTDRTTLRDDVRSYYLSVAQDAYPTTAGLVTVTEARS